MKKKNFATTTIPDARWPNNYCSYSPDKSQISPRNITGNHRTRHPWHAWHPPVKPAGPAGAWQWQCSGGPQPFLTESGKLPIEKRPGFDESHHWQVYIIIYWAIWTLHSITSCESQLSIIISANKWTVRLFSVKMIPQTKQTVVSHMSSPTLYPASGLRHHTMNNWTFLLYH